MSLSLRLFGIQGENKAKIFLKDNGFKILATNFRSRFGEIDIIAQKDRTIYFIEVKTRTSDIKGKPYEAVNRRKLQHMKKASYYFLLKNDYKGYKLKLAVISQIIYRGKTEKIDFYDDFYI